jgi:hypothetical protein
MDIIGLALQIAKFLPDVREITDILTNVLAGDNSQLSSEGSLAGSSGASDIAGSVVGSTMGSLGVDQDLLDKIPQNFTEIYGSIKK